MTDEQNPSEQDGSPDGAEMISEEELDLVLARAATLAVELSEHVGLPAPSYQPQTPDGDAPSDLELDLAELERLVDSASGEISEPAEKDSAADADPTENAQTEAVESADRSVPDFMSEFTEAPATAEPEAPASVPQSASPETTGAKEPGLQTDIPRGVVGSPALGVVGTPKAVTPPEASEDDSFAEEESPEVEAVPGEAESKLNKVRELCSKLVGVVSGKLSPLVAGVCDRGVSLLERVDKPFGKLSDLPRRIIGWLALATLGTALIVLAITAF